MIKLSLESPFCLFEDLLPLTELDFALAHRVLEEPAYAGWYGARRTNRELILDNSYHELRSTSGSLSVEDIVEAAERCRADIVIAPDDEKAPEWTLAEFWRAHDSLGDAFRVGAVLNGHTVEQRKRQLRAYVSADVLCLPYRQPRLEWYKEVLRNWKGKRIHLLGLSSLEEIKEWTLLARAQSELSFSLDTAKPIKAALVGRLVNDGASLRKIPVSSKDLLEIQTVTDEQRELALENVRILRKLLV